MFILTHMLFGVFMMMMYHTCSCCSFLAENTQSFAGLPIQEVRYVLHTHSHTKFIVNYKEHYIFNSPLDFDYSLPGLCPKARKSDIFSHFYLFRVRLKSCMLHLLFICVCLDQCLQLSTISMRLNRKIIKMTLAVSAGTA